jgi:hypothetical protein
MLQRWSNRLIDVLRANIRRGALFTLGGVMALTLTVTPLMSRPAAAQDISSLLSLGGSFTNGLSSCAIETVGWVICPTMRSIAKLADYGFTYINQNFLRIDYNIAANDSGIYKAWEIMRNIANALFVVAFMALIYSQLTGRSSGGYNIKRLLPRLIICAILVNASYYLCVALIDVSNILGDSILNIFKELASRVGTSIMPLDSAAQGFQDGTLSVITSSVMSKSGTAWVLLAPVAAVIISIATITAGGLVLLIMRKTVVAMLVLVSPLLFVAYLLPNLERFFFQGTRLFIQLLMLYPIIALLLGAGQIVSATIVSVGTGDANYRVTGDSYFSRNGGSGSAITDLTAAAAAVLPLLGVWFVFKNMSSVMSTAGSRLSATVNGRRGDKDDKDARVTGKATAGAANNKSINGLDGPLGRRQAFSRNRRHKSLSGSSLTGEEEGNAAARAGLANRQEGGAAAAAQNALDAAGRSSSEDAAKKFEELQNARIEGSSNDLNLEGAATSALADGAQVEEKDKQKTAKDYLDNINKDHQSKDKDRKLSGGQAPAGGNSGGGGNGQQSSGGAVPSAPTVSYKAPNIAQSGNIVTGGAAPTQVRVVAVPVQIDGSALLGQQKQHRPPENVSQPPISGTEEKAKVRAQKYLFDADQDIKEASDKIDLFGHKDTPTEPPHTDTKEHDKDNDQ